MVYIFPSRCRGASLLKKLSFVQVLQRKLHFRLVRLPGQTDLRDYSGRSMKVEPLVTVEGLEKFLNGMVSRLWLCKYLTTFFLH